MIYRIIQPSTHLKAFIKDYLLLHFVFDKLDSVPVKPFPANTQQNLVFYLRGNITTRNSPGARTDGKFKFLHEIIPVIEDFLTKRIQNLRTNFDPIDMVTRMISENNGIISVEKMASDACLSISQFERNFVRQMGITPKLFARITRFYNAYQIKDQNPNIDWLSVALESGYHDYQHLVKDFKQFADSTPHSLLQAQARAPERILGIG